MIKLRYLTQVLPHAAMLRWPCCLCLLFLMPEAAPAQDKSNHVIVPVVAKAGKPVVTADPSHGGLPFFTHYGIEQGLALNNLICSMEDHIGRIWLGTGGGGVSRFDGQNFTNYTTAQGLAANVVFAIREDRQGNIWFGTTAGVSKFDGRKFTNFTTADGLAGNFVSCILPDKTGRLWFGTHDGGVSCFDGKHFINYNNANGLPSNYVRCLLQDKHGTIWLGTDGGGLSKYNGSRFYNYMPGYTVNCLMEDRAGRIWTGTTAGISVYNGESVINYPYPNVGGVYAIVQDQAGMLWLGTGNGGLVKFDGQNFTTYPGSSAIPMGKINSLLLDREGSLWVSSQGGGLNKYWGGGLSYFTTAQGLAGNLVFFITEDYGHKLWFGTYEGGASSFDGKNFTSYTAAQGLGDNIIWGILFDHKGHTWFATDRAGATWFNGQQFRHYSMAQGMVSQSVITMMQDKEGNIWFGSRDNGVSKYDGRRFVNFTTAQGLPGNNIQRVVQDKTGTIWLATHDNGISRFDGRHFRNYGTAEGLVGNHVSTMLLDEGGHLWIGTDQGASEFDGRTFINYTTDQGLPANTITEITEDRKHHRMWFGTNKGLAMLQAGKFKNFNRASGYPLEDVSTSGLFVDRDGVIWMGSGSGKLIRFDPSAVRQTKPPPPFLQLKAIRINNEVICWNSLLKMKQRAGGPDSLILLNEQVTAFGKLLPPRVLSNLNRRFAGIELDSVGRFDPIPYGLVLPSADNQVSIDFAAIAPASSGLIKYQYQLEGYSKDWSPLSASATAVFGNLGPGSYTFKVKALGISGGWGRAAYTFRVLPPWWLTWWSILVEVFAIIMILYKLYRVRVSSLEYRQAVQLRLMVATQEDERRRISRDLHDDVGIKLSSLKLFLSSLYEKSFVSGQEDDVRQLAQNSADLATEVMQDVRQLLRDLSPVVLEEFGYLVAVENLVTRINASGRTQFKLSSFGLEERVQKDHELALYRMTQELVNNVLKHAAAKTASLQAGLRDGELILMIEDDGKGFDTATQTEGFGLHHLAARAAALGGSLQVDSSPGNGTSILINIPYHP